ncbi:MAG: PAS domain S-box protein [Ferruginibacter sp.]
MSRLGIAKKQRSDELMLAHKELFIQTEEKERRTAELIIVNKELLYHKEEKEKYAADLIIANQELLYQIVEKAKRAEELIISTNVDITERKKEEEYFGHMAAIVESSDDAIISKSLDGIIKSWNKGSEKMFGYTAQEAIGSHISLIIPKGNINSEKKILERIGNNEIIAHLETVRNKKSGKQFFVSLTVSPLKDRAGNIIGVSNITRDITSSKKSEAKLIHANKELAFQNEEKEKRASELIIANKELVFQNVEKEKRAAELTIAKRELIFQNEEKEKRAAELIIANIELIFQNEEKEKRAAELIIANRELIFQNKEKEQRTAELIIANKELEQFSYIASHDLQEPLRTVSNYMQVFEEDYLGQLDGNARKYLNSVNNATQRMSLLIKSLLDFSRLGRNTKFTKVDCKKLIYEVMDDLDTMIRTSNAAIEVTEMPQLNVYEIEMRQLFQNLIINAIKFREKDRQLKIRISSEKINGKWKFSLSDNGIGIAPVHFERIFNIFQRLETDENYEGNGIGLANCKKIVRMHQGEIWVESNPVHGVTFYFTISNLKNEQKIKLHNVGG